MTILKYMFRIFLLKIKNMVLLEKLTEILFEVSHKKYKYKTNLEIFKDLCNKLYILPNNHCQVFPDVKKESNVILLQVKSVKNFKLN